MRFGTTPPPLRRFLFGLVVLLVGIGGPWTDCRAGPEPDLDLTNSEQAWLDQNAVIRHVPIPDYAPVESYGADHHPVGIAPDYLSLVAERLGVTIETVRAPDWEAALDSVQQGRADLITAIQKTQSRSEHLAFTEPYLSVPDVILVRTQVEKQLSMADLSGHAVAVVEQYAANEYLRDRYPNIRYRRVANVETGLEKTSFGSVDAMVLGLPVASSAIERTQITNLRVAGKTGYVYRLRFGVGKDQPMLRRVLDKALSSITASMHKTIYNRWISLDQPENSANSNVWYILLTVVGGLLVLLGAGTAWNWSLQREVDRRTDELQTAKADAEEMSRLKSAFLANMNHEFRTPLTSIIGFADTLADKDLEAPANRFSRHIRENGKRLLQTLDSVLHLSQLESGAMTLEPELVSVGEEAERLVGLFEEQAAQTDIRLAVERPDAAIDAHLDPAAFRRVLSNLLSNAIKFSEAGDAVTVRVGQEEGGTIVVEVEDTGVGVDSDFVPKLYDAFEQESSGTDREYEGVGLGLAITRKLTEMMGGTIAVDSEKGSGTRFTVRLPQDRSGLPARMASPDETGVGWQTNGA